MTYGVLGCFPRSFSLHSIQAHAYEEMIREIT